MAKKNFSRDEIIGKQVIDVNAMIIGSVKDLSFDLEAKDIDLVVTAKDGKELTLSSSDMSSVGDVILLKKTLEQIKAPKVIEKKVVDKVTPPPAKLGLCAGCGYQNDTTAKFCIKCGGQLG